MNNIVVFDLETTGLDKSKDFIIQFAAIKIDRVTNKVIDSFNTLVQPLGNYHISIQAYLKHHIKPEMLNDKPTFKDIAQKIIDIFDGCDLLTYNGCSFDIPFLKTEFNRVGIDYDFLKHNCYDAFLEERRRNGNKLEETYARYRGKTMEESGLTAHDAFSDIKATYSIFYAQQRNKSYGPEEMLCEDNVIVNRNFQGNIVPCFTIGKYKDLSVEFVKSFDMNYLSWCVSDSCNFTNSTKNFIKQIISEK